MAFPRIRVRDLSTFLECLRNSGRTAFSSRIKVYNVDGGFSCHIEIEEGGSDGAGSAPFNECYDTQAAVLQAMRTLIECTCPVWKSAEFFFRGSFIRLSSEYSTLIGDMLPLLRSSPSLSTIRLDGYSDGLNLPSMVCDNPVLETLILSDSPFRASKELEYAQDLAVCFSRNSVLKSCSIGASFSTAQVLEVALKPLMPSSEGQANVALKELVLKGVIGSAAVKAVANLVRGNTTLEKLELGLFLCSTQEIRLVPQALTVNRTVNEFRWRCDPAGLKELAGAFTADYSGRQVNAHLTTLKLFPHGKLSEFMEELYRVLERNTTLKQVEVDPGTGSWEVRSLIAPRYGSKECVQDIVESIVIGKKLRVNTSLESVVVGSWKLVRVDGHGEWQMKYCGPCLRRRSPLAGETQYHVENDASLGYVSSRYDVKVKMRR